VFKTLLIANRGEIAVRIARTATRLGIETVALASPADDGALHTRKSDRVAKVSSYLAADEIVATSVAVGAQAVHPGYGFLAEDADFARAVEAAGLLWAGPPPPALALAGDKLEALRVAEQTGIPTLASGSPDELGFPLLVKAAAGGGGRGMRTVAGPDDLDDAVASARREAGTAFGDDRIYYEQLLTGARHIEVQLLADQHGQIATLGDRDCSIQRRHQKVIEEAPAPGLSSCLREELSIHATSLARNLGYANAGTVEFLVDGDRAYFLECNARLQVEHPVTEEAYGLDLVEWQLRIAAGEALDVPNKPVAHAVEARLYAEHPVTFLPQAGLITDFRLPPGIRVDAGVESGDAVSADYDPLVAKLIARGTTREKAFDLLVEALEATRVQGLMTNRALLLWVLEHHLVRAGLQTTSFLDLHPPFSRDRSLGDEWRGGFRLNTPADALAPAAPPSIEASRGRLGAAGAVDGLITAPMPGTVTEVLVTAGDVVEPHQRLLALEAMKMETPITAPLAGTVERVAVDVGDQVARGDLVVEIAAS